MEHAGQAAILAFYAEIGPDDRGRSLRDVWAMTDADLERVHDYIQWLFPLPERSSANAAAPTLDARTIAAFAERDDLRQRLELSLDRMLRFYGLTMSGEQIERAPDFAQRSRSWLRAGNHNHLRLTRIIRSLHVLSLPAQAQALYRCLLTIAAREPSSVTSQTLGYWQRAAAGARP